MRCPEFLRSIGIDDPAEINRLRRRKIELYPRYFDLVALNRPLWEFCQQFRAQGGRVWIVSTGQRANIDNVMRHLHLEAGVDGIISAHRRANPIRAASSKRWRSKGRRPTKRSSSRIRPSASKRHAAAERPISS